MRAETGCVEALSRELRSVSSTNAGHFSWVPLVMSERLSYRWR
jgi:hypothetical protein